jgi:hypothetical protein
MRQMDEITERQAPRQLPAPTGPRSPTGPVPLILPPTAIPPPADAVPVVPYLPAVAAKAANPITSPVATTVLATSLIVPGPEKPPDEPPKRKHKLLIALAIVVVITALLAVLLRNTAFGQRFTGKGYDTNPLPPQAFDRPAFTGSEYMITTQHMSVTDGLPTNFWETERDIVNYTTPAAKMTLDRAKASVVGGTIGEPKAVEEEFPVFLDQQMMYYPGATPADPWIREPHGPGWHAQQIFSPDTILMYQDVFDPALRSQVPISVDEEILHEVAVTTYKYTFTFGDFYESSPRLFELFRVVDGNAADDATVNVTVSLDGQWVVRYLDIDVDYHSVLEHRSKKDVGVLYPYRYTMDVIKITDQPETLPVPTNAVDPTTTTLAPLVPEAPAVTP